MRAPTRNSGPRVGVVEWLADEACAYIPSSRRTQLMVSLDGASRIAMGDEVEIYVGVSKVHLFDPMAAEDQWSICPTPTPAPAPAASAVARPRRGQGLLTAGAAELTRPRSFGRVSLCVSRRTSRLIAAGRYALALPRRYCWGLTPCTRLKAALRENGVP
jgi:hypothetical protein